MPFKTKMEAPVGPRLIEVRDGAFCDECGAEIDDEQVTAIFCKSCATRLINTCKGLGRAMEAQSTF